jgi:hypothetical protein
MDIVINQPSLIEASLIHKHYGDLLAANVCEVLSLPFGVQALLDLSTPRTKAPIPTLRLPSTDAAVPKPQAKRPHSDESEVPRPTKVSRSEPSSSSNARPSVGKKSEKKPKSLAPTFISDETLDQLSVDNQNLEDDLETDFAVLAGRIKSVDADLGKDSGLGQILDNCAPKLIRWAIKGFRYVIGHYNKHKEFVEFVNKSDPDEAGLGVFSSGLGYDDSWLYTCKKKYTPDDLEIKHWSMSILRLFGTLKPNTTNALIKACEKNIAEDMDSANFVPGADPFERMNHHTSVVPAMHFAAIYLTTKAEHFEDTPKAFLKGLNEQRRFAEKAVAGDVSGISTCDDLDTCDFPESGFQLALLNSLKGTENVATLTIGLEALRVWYANFGKRKR